MPDILIRGISLAECFGRTIEIGCDADGHVFAYVDNGETAILDIVELPPHGELIDRDKIRYTELYGGVEVTTANWIDSLPVVVPAEKGETQ